jgi:hypothetical protein
VAFDPPAVAPSRDRSNLLTVGSSGWGVRALIGGGHPAHGGRGMRDARDCTPRCRCAVYSRAILANRIATVHHHPCISRILANRAEGAQFPREWDLYNSRRRRPSSVPVKVSALAEGVRLSPVKWTLWRVFHVPNGTPFLIRHRRPPRVI